MSKRVLRCGTHGRRVPAVVCRHMLEALDEVVGFVENSSEPDDLQAWCDECERMFVAEGQMTAAFREMNGMSVVCDLCYARLKERHAGMGS